MVKSKATDTPAPPVPDDEAEDDGHDAIEGLRGDLAALQTRVEQLNEGELRTWMEKQIQTMEQRLANLEANSTTGLENLSKRITELQEQLILKSQEVPPRELAPPQAPPANPPPKEKEDVQVTPSGRRHRVI